MLLWFHHVLVVRIRQRVHQFLNRDIDDEPEVTRASLAFLARVKPPIASTWGLALVLGITHGLVFGILISIDALALFVNGSDDRFLHIQSLQPSNSFTFGVLGAEATPETSS